MNRADRRKHKKKPAWRKETSAQQLERIVRTGEITLKDLEREYENGKRNAIKSCEEYLVPFFFSALACALKSNYKFGEERIIRVFKTTIENMNGEILVDDMIARCKRETGLDVLRYVKENPV
jgi:hypothetical protein